MNKAIVIGNLTRDPDLRQTQSGISVCSFTVAVNRRRHTDGQPEADYFRVTAWRGLADSCGKYLAKGRKVGCTGPVSVSTYEKDGKVYTSLELAAEEVEFLSPARSAESGSYTPADDEELPPDFR